MSNSTPLGKTVKGTGSLAAVAAIAIATGGTAAFLIPLAVAGSGIIAAYNGIDSLFQSKSK